MSLVPRVNLQYKKQFFFNSKSNMIIPYINYRLFKKFLKRNIFRVRKKLVKFNLYNLSMRIFKFMYKSSNLKFFLYNGRKFVNFNFTKLKIFLIIGEFVTTRVVNSGKILHKRKKK